MYLPGVAPDNETQCHCMTHRVAGKKAYIRLNFLGENVNAGMYSFCSVRFRDRKANPAAKI
jgi:hypothetical protein